MEDRSSIGPILVIPCSGIGKVHGLLSREATYLATDVIAPKQLDTMCLALLVKGDSEAIDAVKTQTCITIDGCSKACAEKNVQIAGGTPAGVVQVIEVLKAHRGAKPGTPNELTKEGWSIAREIAAMVVDAAAHMNGDKEKSR